MQNTQTDCPLPAPHPQPTASSFRLSPTSASSPLPGPLDEPPRTPPASTEPGHLPHHLRFNSPTYGLDPEVVALLGRTPRLQPHPSAAARLRSPPRVPFDGAAADANVAWERWLNERASYRRAHPLAVPAAETEGSLGRLRESAERLQDAEARVGSMRRPQPDPVAALQSAGIPDSLINFADSLEEPRRALEQVRQRLDETRRRVEAVATSARRREREQEEAAQRALDRTVDFASRWAACRSLLIRPY